MNEVLNIEYIRENIVSDSLYNDFIVMESDSSIIVSAKCNGKDESIKLIKCHACKATLTMHGYHSPGSLCICAVVDSIMSA